LFLEELKMDILVCIKRIPTSSESTDIIEIDASRKDIKREKLYFRINNWDEYALEEAVQIKEKQGGTITAITVGLEECDDILRRALAMGADKAIRLSQNVSNADPYVVANVLTSLIRTLPYNLIMFGMQSDDFGNAQLGPMVAEMLNIPHVTAVTRLQLRDKEVKVYRELEMGALEIYTLELPAVLTIQTGINKPRYISFTSIKRARDKELKVIEPEEIGTLSPLVRLVKLVLPQAGKMVVISGSAEEGAAQLIDILIRRGVL
jgi:electron transfer flavoprotein beta subunit